MTNPVNPSRRREPTRPKDEVVRLGDEIYLRDIKILVKDDHDGEFLAIDVDSELWALGENGRHKRVPPPRWVQSRDQVGWWRSDKGERLMIRGRVNARNEAIVTLTLQGPDDQSQDIDVVVDTGFGSFLTLPPAVISELELPYSGFNRVELADGSETSLNYYDITVVWDGQPRNVVVFAADAIPLLGMSLMHGHNLNIDVLEGGGVTIQPIG